LMWRWHERLRGRWDVPTAIEMKNDKFATCLQHR
jgi:hypothetical protein